MFPLLRSFALSVIFFEINKYLVVRLTLNILMLALVFSYSIFNVQGKTIFYCIIKINANLNK